MSRAVMVVEDNRLHRRLYCAILQSQGYDPIEVSDGKDALSIATSSKFVAAVIDILLLGIDGREIIKALRLDHRTVLLPILAVSAMSQLETEQSCIEAGANCFYAKPVALTTFIRAMSHLTMA